MHKEDLLTEGKRGNKKGKSPRDGKLTSGSDFGD